MDDLPRCRATTWGEIDGWADRLSDGIRAAGLAPEALVALTRGGWVPARLLADRLGVHRLLPLRVRHWGVTATMSGRAELTDDFPGSVAGERILIVDDICDTGESLELARAHVAARGPAQLETATFLHIADSKLQPTHFAEEIARDAWVWVVFPWNYWEDLRALAGRVAGAKPASVRRTLAERCGWTVPLAHVEKVLAAPPA
ncbi:MAG: phosphoribosyltransferase [Thermoplasmata archaeon]